MFVQRPVFFKYCTVYYLCLYRDRYLSIVLSIIYVCYRDRYLSIALCITYVCYKDRYLRIPLSSAEAFLFVCLLVGVGALPVPFVNKMVCRSCSVAFVMHNVVCVHAMHHANQC